MVIILWAVELVSFFLIRPTFTPTYRSGTTVSPCPLLERLCDPHAVAGQGPVDGSGRIWRCVACATPGADCERQHRSGGGVRLPLGERQRRRRTCVVADCALRNGAGLFPPRPRHPCFGPIGRLAVLLLSVCPESVACCCGLFVGAHLLRVPGLPQTYLVAGVVVVVVFPAYWLLLSCYNESRTAAQWSAIFLCSFEHSFETD